MAGAETIFGGLTTMTIAAFLASLGLAAYVGNRRRETRTTLSAPLEGKTIGTPKAGLKMLPVEREDPDLLETAAISRHIAGLMLDNEWTEIGNEIAGWERRLASTPGGARYHDIACDTALSGLQGLIDDAPRAAISDLDAAEVELSHFVDTFQRAPEDHVQALLAARAHLTLGEAFRADHWPEPLHAEAWRRMARHFVAAGAILDTFDPIDHISPLLAEAHYRHALGSPGGAARLPDLYARWIDLDPANPAIYDFHADLLADPDFYTDQDILNEADRATARTEDTMGLAGYAMFFLPLFDRRRGARDLADPDLLATALMNLADTDASQAEVNRAANALAVEAEATGNIALSDTLYLMVQTQLDVIYPRLWTLSEDSIQMLVQEAAETIPELVTDILPKTGNLARAA